ncbi:MAG: hypothetical protein DRJ49_07510, partial [Thermoprotei archaeon]
GQWPEISDCSAFTFMDRGRIPKTDTRVWTVIKNGYNLSNKKLSRKNFKIKSIKLKRDDVRELMEEDVEKVVEFA